MATIIAALRVTVVTLVLTGIAYPLLVTGVARLIFPEQARGSLVKSDDGSALLGSKLLAQRAAGPAYFEPRPSAAGAGYDPLASGGSNLGPSSRKLRDRIVAEIERLRVENPNAPAGPIPVELVTASGSGLDPHLSPGAARWQAPRIATARDVPVGRVLGIIDQAVEGRTLGFLGEPRVNVLLMNLALDKELGRPAELRR